MSAEPRAEQAPQRRPRGPFVVDIRRNSLDDGPGIRSVVFFKGCPLRCVWCQNPESLAPWPELQREPERCAACDACRRACEHAVARPAAQRQERDRCRVCGACVEACPAQARRVAGERYDVAALEQVLARDAPFFRRSGGGVTLSGGEPTLFAAFAGQLAARLRDRGIHVLLETCGHFGWEAFRQHLLPHVSTIYFDVKLADSVAHRQHTGRDNRLILENLRRLREAGGAELLPRVPLIPGITDGSDNLAALAAMLRGLGLRRLVVLPYHPLWVHKRQALGMDLPYAHRRWMTEAEVHRCVGVLQSAGLEVLR